MLSTEASYRDQISERNTLLLTIHQYMEKILGVDKTPVSAHLRSRANAGADCRTNP